MDAPFDDSIISDTTSGRYFSVDSRSNGESTRADLKVVRNSSFCKGLLKIFSKMLFLWLNVMKVRKIDAIYKGKKTNVN
jgi:hypothetical protein